MNFKEATLTNTLQNEIVPLKYKPNDINSFVILKNTKDFDLEEKNTKNTKNTKDTKNTKKSPIVEKNNLSDLENEIDSFTSIRDDSIKLQFYQDIQLLCEFFLEETLLLDIPPLQKCRTHNKSFFSEICFFFEDNYEIISHSLKDDDLTSVDDDNSVC